MVCQVQAFAQTQGAASLLPKQHEESKEKDLKLLQKQLGFCQFKATTSLGKA
jgi:hypothetical protein